MITANKNLFKIKPYVPGKPIDEVKRELGLSQVIKLASNENPYPPSAKVLKAIYKAASQINRYPDGGCFALRGALAKRLGLNPQQLIFGNGSDEIIVLAVKAFVKEKDEVILAKPSFLIYTIASVIAGAQLKEVPLVDFHYDLGAMLAKITKRTRMIFLGNPDNPAGTYITHAQALDFMQQVPGSTIVFFDEAYFEYVNRSDYADSLKLLRQFPNMIITRTFSKMYGLAGLRVGYGIAQESMIDVLNRAREPFNVNSIAQAAALAALADGPYYRRIAKDVEKQRQYLYASLEAMNIHYIKSFTNFILVQVGTDSTTIAQALLKQGIIIRDMATWGLKGFIRVSIGTATENKKFISAFKKVI